MSSRFLDYQYMGDNMTDLHKRGINSTRFYNNGKWDNFILPFLPDNCQDMTFIEGGSNLGLFLQMAEAKGFRRVVGVECDKEIYNKAIAYREKNRSKYQLKNRFMEKQVPWLPAADYVLLANTHYYFEIEKWVNFVSELVLKTRYCIIVTARKPVERRDMAPSSVEGIKNSFSNWELVGVVKPSREGDPLSREQWGLCFKSPLIERVPLDSIKYSKKQYNNFWQQLDEGFTPKDTDYYKRLLRDKMHKYSQEHLTKVVEGEADFYNNVKERGVLKPFLITPDNIIRDGSHRLGILKHLGHKSALVRKI